MKEEYNTIGNAIKDLYNFYIVGLGIIFICGIAVIILLIK